MAVSHKQMIDVPLAYDAAFDLCQAAAKEVLRAKVKSATRETGMITARTGINMKTYGDIITFQIWPVNPTLTRMEIESRTAVSLTIVDMGREGDNVRELVAYISYHAQMQYTQQMQVQYAQQQTAWQNASSPPSPNAPGANAMRQPSTWADFDLDPAPERADTDRQ